MYLDVAHEHFCISNFWMHFFFKFVLTKICSKSQTIFLSCFCGASGYFNYIKTFWRCHNVLSDWPHLHFSWNRSGRASSTKAMTTGLLHEEERVAGRPSGQQAQSRSLSAWQDAAAWPPILVRGPKSGWKTPVSLAPAPGTDGWILCICSWAWLASGAGIYMDCLYTACWPPKNEHVRRVKNMRRPFYALHVRSGPHWPNWFWDRRKVSMPQWIKDKRVRSSHTDIKKIRTFDSRERSYSFHDFNKGRITLFTCQMWLMPNVNLSVKNMRWDKGPREKHD